MENIGLLIDGFGHILSWNHILLMIVGVTLGILVGVLPGLGAPNGVSLLLPLTFSMDPISAIILLSCMYWGALFGGSTTSILFNIPGEPSSVATTFDGYPMARAGHASRALTLAFVSAGLGALAGVVMITLLSGWVANFALKFSSPEYFAVYFLAFASFISMGAQSPFKTLVSMMLGFALASIGMDTISGNLRLTFDIPELIKGVSFLIAVMGLFGIGELLLTTEEGLRFEGIKARVRLSEIGRTLIEIPRYWLTIARSTIIGIWMGITPAGPTAASFMSYGVARRSARDKSMFGKGDPRGIVAPGRPTIRPAIGPAADAGARRPGFRHRRGDDGRVDDLGPDARPDALHRSPGLRLGSDRLHVSRQCRRRLPRDRDGAALRLDPARAVLDHRTDHRRGDLLGGLPGRELRLGHLHGDRLRSPRLWVQEARLPAGAAGSRHGARRQGGRRLPPVDADVGRQPRHLLVERPCLRPDGRRPCAASVAALLLADRHIAQAQERGCRFERRRQRGGLTGCLVRYP